MGLPHGLERKGAHSELVEVVEVVEVCTLTQYTGLGEDSVFARPYRPDCSGVAGVLLRTFARTKRVSFWPVLQLPTGTVNYHFPSSPGILTSGITWGFIMPLTNSKRNTSTPEVLVFLPEVSSNGTTLFTEEQLYCDSTTTSVDAE